MHRETSMKLAVAFAALLSAVAFADPPDTIWTRRFGGPNTNGALSVAIAADSGYLVAGFKNGYTATKAWFIHTNHNGDTTWQVSDYTSGQAFYITSTSSGGSLVCGFYRRTYPDTSIDAWVSKRDARGDQYWRANLAYGDRTWIDQARAVAETHDGGCIVAVATVMMSGHAWLVRLKPGGDTAWTRARFAHPYWTVPYWVAETPDRCFAVVGHSSAGTQSDFFLLRTDSLGDTLWCRTWGGVEEDRAYGGTATHDNGFALCGYTESFGAGRSDIWVVRADSAGDTLWARTYGSAGDEQGFGISETADRGFLICGYRGTNPWLIRTDSLGDTLWTKTLAGGGTFSSVKPTPEGDIIVAGQRGTDAWLVKLAGQSAITEEHKLATAGPLPATVVGSTLRLAGDRPADLVDCAGRVALRLMPGNNDLSGIQRGIYVIKPLDSGAELKITVCR